MNRKLNMNKGVYAMVTRPFFNRAGLFIFSVLFAVSMIAGTELYAQNDDAPTEGSTPKTKQHGEQNEDDPMGKKKSGPPPEVKGPEGMADHMSKMLTERLSLSEEQKIKVYDIVFAYASNHNKSDFDHKELDSQIETVLNNDQTDKFREFIKNGPDRNVPPVQNYDDAPANK